MLKKIVLRQTVCRHSYRELSVAVCHPASRHLGYPTFERQQQHVIKDIAKTVEQERKRLEKEKRKKNRKDAMLSFYKKSIVLDKNFKQKFAVRVICGIPELHGQEMLLTKISVDNDLTTLKVYWNVKSPEKEKIVSGVLSTQHKEISNLATKEFGEIPNIEFVFDKTFVQGAHMNELFAEISEHLPNQEDTLFDEISSLQLGGDATSIDRDSILKTVEMAKEKSRAEHRYNAQEDQRFREEYLKSVEYSGGESKKETRREIRKFLAQRNANHTLSRG